MVTKDEAGRYLDSCLSNLSIHVDDIVIYDDDSVDATQDIALAHNVTYIRRNGRGASFVEEEGTFRSQAWKALGETISVSTGDWVLAIDADEFLVGDVVGAAQILENGGWSCGTIRFHEIWEIGEPHKRRIDGYWNNILNVRLARYQSNSAQLFSKRGMGCGSVPKYALALPADTPLPVEILHFGYAVQEDREKKYQFYSNLKHGHNNAHIESILKHPKLEEIEFDGPQVWRGQ